MHYLALIGTVTAVHLLGAISPGPDFIMAVRNSLNYGRRAGIWTSVGFGLGISIHIFYCLAGLAIIISKSILAFNFIKFLGAGYLIYIGIKSFFSKSSQIEVSDEKNEKNISSFEALKMGFFTNILNPKASLFFLSLFTFVISPDTPKYVMAILSLIMILDTMLWFSLVSIFFTQEKVQELFNKYQGAFNKVFGALLIGLGIKIGLSKV